jgi:hypothetical protein
MDQQQFTYMPAELRALEREIQTETLNTAADTFARAIGKAPITGTRVARMLRDMAPELQE